MLNIIVVDDERQAREAVISIINNSCADIKIIAEAENVADAVKKIDRYKPDIVLLDVNMPDGTGFDVFSRIHYKDFKTILITAYDTYAIRAIKLSAVDYLLKPVNTDELIRAIQKAKIQAEKEQDKIKISAFLNNFSNITNNNPKIVLKTAENIYVVNVQNIVHCESDNNYTTLYLNDKQKIIISKTLKEFEHLLKDFGFLRVHRSNLININYIMRFDKEKNLLYMQDNSKIQVSFRKKEELIKIFDNLMNL